MVTGIRTGESQASRFQPSDSLEDKRQISHFLKADKHYCEELMTAESRTSETIEGGKR